MKKIFTILIFLLLPINCFGAVLFFDPTQNKVHLGSEFMVDLKIEANDESVNAIEAVLEFSDNLEVVRIDHTNSIINAWIIEPKFGSNRIEFAGLIPGGFNGVYEPPKSHKFPGNLISIIFKAKKPGDGAVSFEDVKILKNDGLAGEVQVSLIPFAFDITGEESPFLFFKFIVIIIMIAMLILIIKLWKRF